MTETEKLLDTYLDGLLMLQSLHTTAVFRLPRDPQHEENLRAQIKAEKAKIIARFMPKPTA